MGKGHKCVVKARCLVLAILKEGELLLRDGDTEPQKHCALARWLLGWSVTLYTKRLWFDSWSRAPTGGR